jgi:hypothetical protein
MMKIDLREVTAAAAPGVLLALGMGATLGVLAGTASELVKHSIRNGC